MCAVIREHVKVARGATGEVGKPVKLYGDEKQVNLGEVINRSRHERHAPKWTARDEPTMDQSMSVTRRLFSSAGVCSGSE